MQRAVRRLEETTDKRGVASAANLFARWRASAPYLLSVLRIVAAFMFILAGTMKLFAFPAGIPPSGGTAPLMSEVGLAGVLETFGGTLLLLGALHLGPWRSCSRARWRWRTSSLPFPRASGPS